MEVEQNGKTQRFRFRNLTTWKESDKRAVTGFGSKYWGLEIEKGGSEGKKEENWPRESAKGQNWKNKRVVQCCRVF
ncbi:conserved hypothetical protein [Ricinus communis]|uniref:Uncharacterized protein n=1 Tax=Ricinus communis TaxID=3988 RepID=B9SBI3_RICCO|nr:conserved hypothetical protein [Ricinus communis]